MLVVLGSGGHTAQILRLVDLLGDKYNYEYVIGREDKTSEKRIKYPGRIFRLNTSRLMKDKSLFIVYLKMVPTTIDALKILFSTKAMAVLSAGPASSLPLFFLAKRLFKKKTIYIESWVRVRSKSLTGGLIYPHSNLFFVQWPEMKKQYPKAVFVGRLD